MAYLSLIFDQKMYFPNDLVHGKIRLKTKTQLHIKKIELKIKNFRLFELIEKVDELQTLRKKKPRIIKETNILIVRNYEICAGDHEFPFTFSIPSDAEAYSIMNNNVCRFENKTILESFCLFKKEKLTASKLLIIYNRVQDFINLDIKIKIGSLFCLYNKNYFYRITIDKLFYIGGENIQIKCFPSKNINKRLILSIETSLYEIIFINKHNNKILRSKFIQENKLKEAKKNEFEGKIKIPYFICGTFIGKEIIIKVGLFFKLKLSNGDILRIKKYINTGRPDLTVPEIEEESLFKTIVHDINFIEY